MLKTSMNAILPFTALCKHSGFSATNLTVFPYFHYVHAAAKVYTHFILFLTGSLINAPIVLLNNLFLDKWS
jgi:hypothetical protein